MDDIRRRIVELLPRLRRFALALSKNKDLSDDLVQETCVRMLSKLDQWQDGTRLDSWMFRIAQNAWIDRLRSGKSRGEVVDIATAVDLLSEDGRDVTEARLTLQVVSSAIDKLPPEQQIVIALTCIDGLTYQETADILKVPIGTVMSRLARGRKALHAALELNDDQGNGSQGGAQSGGSVG
jgi:RNA polymerase sigma-70 factor, ECF subfamily